MASARTGKTRTLSISVDAATEKILKEEAAAHFGGNVSKLVAAIAREAQRKAAIDRIMAWSGMDALSKAERDEIDAGILKDIAAQTQKQKQAQTRRRRSG